MDLKNKLLKDIHDLSNKSEKSYAGVAEDLDSVKSIGSDIGTTILGVVKEILDGAQEDSLDGLKHRIKRAEELKKNLEKAALGPEETGILNSCISRVTFAIESHIQQKRKVLNAASGAISKITPHLGTAMLGMTYNNPVMQLAVMAGGKLSQIVKNKMQKSKESRDVLKGDAKKLYSSTFSQTGEESQPQSAPQPKRGAPVNENDPTFQYNPLENFNSDGSAMMMDPGAGYGKTGLEIASDVNFIAEELLQVIDGLKPLEEISKNIEKLVRAAGAAEDAKDQLTLDNLESAAEGPSIPDGLINKKEPGAKAAKGEGLLGKLGGAFELPEMAAVAETALAGLSGVLFTATTGIVAALGWAVIDGVSGWLKSEDWGVSKISGFLGGLLGGTFSNKIVNVFANMGKWALMGAFIGAPFFGIGAIAGGLIGALIGGLLGWIGGENIAGFFDDFGSWISDSWSTGFDMIKNFFLDLWDTAQNMVDSVLNVIDSVKLAIVGWVKGTIDWLVSKDPTGWAEGKFKPLTDGLGQMQDGLQKDIEDRAKRREQRDADSLARHNQADAERQQRNDAYTANQEQRAIKQEQWRSGESPAGGAAEAGGAPAKDLGGAGPGIGAIVGAQAGTGGQGEFISSATGKPVPSTGFDGKPSANVPQDVAGNLQAVKDALTQQGITSPEMHAAVLGNVMKETGGKSISENMNYAKTSNERIRKIFGSRAAGKSDAELDQIKRNPQMMGEMMYGKGTKMGQSMGNTEEGDGYKFRGRGFIQLTGKNNYTKASMEIFGDDRLVKNPDLVNDPAIAAQTSAWYMKKGQAGMAKKLGIDANNMTQTQANLLATSQIAGGDIRKKGAIGEELYGKVDRYSRSAQITQIAHQQGVTPDLQGASVVPASYDTVNKQSAAGAQTAPNIVNTVNNTSSVSNGGSQQQSRPNDTGTSSMRSTVLNAYRA